MILPVVTYGFPVLRKQCSEIETNSDSLQSFIDSMWETMYSSNGQGLAASQVDEALKLFTVDNAQVYDQLNEEERSAIFDGDQGIKETFINAKILNRSHETWVDHEGCLSLPGLYEPVERPWSIEIEYLDRNFVAHKKEFRGITARVIQHEYDHTDGLVFVDRLAPLRKRLLSGKLKRIVNGKVKVDYLVKKR